MAAPALVSESAGSANASATTSHTIRMPATVGSGDRLVAAIGMSANNATVPSFTWPAGWTEILDTHNDQWFGCSASVAWKIADGTEDSTDITVTSTTSERSTHKSWCFSGAASVYAGSANSSGASSTSNPPSLNPGLGSKDYHWIAVSVIDSFRTVSTYPTGYTNTGYKQSAATSFDNDSTIGWGRKTSTASSEDPAAFTWNNADTNIAITIAVAPAILLPTILTVGPLTPGATVAVTYENYVSVPLTANSTLGGVGITVSGATGSGCNIVVPDESAFLFGGSLAALEFNVNTPLVLANGSETDSHTVQVTVASSDQLAERSAAPLAWPLASYNGGLVVATGDPVYQYSDPADSFTPNPAINQFTPQAEAFTIYSKWFDRSAGSWSGLTTKLFPTPEPPGGGTLEITSTMVAQNPPGSLTPADVDLTAFGGLDWLKAARLTAATFDTKSGGAMIGAPADIGTPAWARDTGDSAGHPLVKWTDGAELGTHHGDRGYDRTTVNGAGRRIPISPAGALVKIYLLVGGYNSASFDVEVSFSDSSAPPVSVGYTTGPGVHEQYLYEITAQPAGGAATIQVDFTKISGQLVGWQAIAVASGTEAAVYSLTSPDTTLTPGQVVPLTLVGGPFQGAVTTACLVFGPYEIPVLWSVVSPSRIDLTMPALEEFFGGQDAKRLRMYANFVIRIEAGSESAETPNTNQIVPPNAGDFGIVAAPPWGGDSPPGAQQNDECYGELVSGAGVFTPETFGFAETEPSIIRWHVYNLAIEEWLPQDDVYIGYAGKSSDLYIRAVRIRSFRRLVNSYKPSRLRPFKF